jgi:cytochrome c oxidase subunit 3
MATTVHEPPKVNGIEPHQRSSSNGGNGGFRDMGPREGSLRAVHEHAPPPSKTGIWVLLGAIGMMFAAFTSALIVRQGASNDWHHLVLPRILYFNTVALIASSITLEFARRRIAVFMGGLRGEDESPGLWLYVTMLLGIVFVIGQYFAWLQLRAEGLYLATNPNSSFFYVLTAVHAVHVLGGMAGMTYVLDRLRQVRLRRSTLDSFSYYWHFMGILWVYLLLLLWIRL